MNNTERTQHWDSIYTTKNLDEVSWYQPKPSTSLELIEFFNVSKSDRIIDIGGGDGFFVDHLIEMGYSNISVLDISAAAIEKAKLRLGEKARFVNWIVADITKFQPTQQYDFWHDRAAFHFLTHDLEINNYTKLAASSIAENGVLVMGTFSEDGPKKCSGIEIKNYSEESLSQLFEFQFQKEIGFTVDHETPFETSQNFVFCGFRKKE